MNKRILFYNPFAAWSFHFETSLELIKQHVDKKDEVIVLVCNRDLEVCEPNYKHNYYDCHACITRRKNGFRLLGLTDKVSFRSFKNLKEGQLEVIDRYQVLDLKTIDDLKAVTLEKCDIGMAVASSLIDYTREAEPDMSKYRGYVNKSLRAALSVYFSMRNNIKELKPDEIYIFNGRFAALRPALRAAQELGIKVKVHERPGALGKYSLTEGSYPHDWEIYKRNIIDTWEKSTLELSQKIHIGEQWYHDCRYSGKSKELLGYKVKQEDVLPPDFDPDKYNVVIFSSSELEFAAISGFEDRLYKNQNEGVQKIVEDLQGQSNVQVYLRVHPNLKQMRNSQTRFIESITGLYPNLTVIDAKSPINSYKLLDACNMVIAFGSTMGMEAVYYGKICLLARRTPYEVLNACIQVSSHAELVNIIKNRSSRPQQDNDLEARKLAAIKYGFFNKMYGTPFLYFQHHGMLRVTYNGQAIIPDFWFIRRVISRLERAYRDVIKNLRQLKEFK